MGKRAAAFVLVFAASGCTQVVDAPPKPGAPVAPITAGQVNDPRHLKVVVTPQS